MNLHLKTSFDYIRRSPFQALAAVSVLTLTFFIGTLLAVLVYSSNQTLRYFETRPQVIAFLKDDAQPPQISDLQNKLSSDGRLKDVKYVSKEQALEIYKKATADNPLLSELVSPSIFPASLEFSVVDLTYAQSVIDQVKSDPIVQSVGFTASLGKQDTLGDVVQKLKTATYYIRVGGLVLVGILTISSFLVLMVVIGMRITTRRTEIETLSLLGATPKFIRSPIVLEAVNYSIMGVAVGWLFAFILILYISPTLINYFGEIPVLPRQMLTFFELLGAILGLEVIVGLIIAFMGSRVAINRALRK
ncbi:permease-like cell division protein FtsX [Candidatus Microgenomates bacterium]|nr:permease-like cell division protein FtsX [Candidatus Microgenomates bacterium]